MATISQYIQRQSCNTDKLMFDSKQAQVWQIEEHEKPDYIGSYEVVRLVDVLEGEEGEGVFSAQWNTHYRKPVESLTNIRQ